jgi:hypothetical protein
VVTVKRFTSLMLHTQVADAKNNFTEMCSGSEAGSYLRLIDFCILGLRIIKKKEIQVAGRGRGDGARAGPPRVVMVDIYSRLIDSCITQLEAKGLSRTCKEGKEQEEASPIPYIQVAGRGGGDGVRAGPPRVVMVEMDGESVAYPASRRAPHHSQDRERFFIIRYVYTYICFYLSISIYVYTYICLFSSRGLDRRRSPRS